MAAVTENIVIQIREDGSRVVVRNVKEVGKAAKDSAEDVDLLRGAMAALATAFAIDKLQQWSDTWGTAAGLIRTSTKSMDEAVAVQNALYESAQRTRSEYSSVVELYSRAARAGKDLGASQSDVIKFTEGVGKALAIQGTSAEQAAGALLQLGQALGNGKIQAEEYNSLLDGGTVILQTVADNLKGAEGSVGNLTKMVKGGTVTSKEFFDAFMAGSDQLDGKFKMTSISFGQGWQVMENAMVKFVGQMNESLGLSNKFGEFAQWFAANTPRVAAAIAALGATLAVAFSASKITEFYGQIQKLFALLMAHPFVALAAAIAGVLTYLYMMRDEIKLGVGDTTTLGDLMRSMWEDVGPAITGALDLTMNFFKEIGIASAGTFDQLINDLVGYEHENDSTWMKLLRVVVKVFDMIGAVIRGVFMAVTGFVKSQIDLWVGAFAGMAKQVQQVFAGDFEGAFATGQETMAKFAENAKTMGSDFVKNFDEEILRQQDSGLEAWLDDRIKRAQEIAKQRVGDGKTAPGLGGGGKPPATTETPDKKAAKELERLRNELRQLKDEADPVGAALRQLADDQKTLDKAIKAGLITTKEAAGVMEELKFRVRDQLDPLAAVNRELDDNARLLKLSSQQAEIEQQMLTTTQKLRMDGVKLTKEETDALRARLVVEQQLSKIAQEKDYLRTQSVGGEGGKTDQFQTMMESIRQLQEEAGSGFGLTDAFNAANDAMNGLFDNTKQGLAAQLEEYALMNEQVSLLLQSGIISEQTASQARLAIWQMEQQAKLQMVQSTLGQVATLMSSSNKKAFAIGKAAAIAQALVNTYLSATSAMAQMPWPVNIAAAAAAVVAGIANVSKIRAQQMPAYRTGGSWTVGGSGGVDSQTVAFRATPGEKININTPAQARALERGVDDDSRSRGRRSLTQNVTIVQAGRPDNNTAEQQARQLRRTGERELMRNN